MSFPFCFASQEELPSLLQWAGSLGLGFDSSMGFMKIFLFIYLFIFDMVVNFII
jgi:hypothetical protein